MRFTKSGKTLSGTWGVGVQIDNVLYRRPGNNACPMADGDFVFQSEDSASPMIMRGYESGKAPEIIDRPGANFLRAGSSVYGASLTPGGCRTNTGYKNADEVIVEVTPDDYVITVVHQVGRDLTIRSRDGVPIKTIQTQPLYGGSMDRVAIRSLDRLRLAWIEGDLKVYTYNIDHVRLSSAAFWVVPVEWHGSVWLLELGGERLTFRHAMRTTGYIVTTDETFSPDVRVVDGRMLVGWGVNQGESSVKVVEVDMDAPEVPLDNVPPPPPEGDCIPGIGKRLWMTPYWERSLKYGDCPAQLGNSLLCLGPGDVAHNAPTSLPLFSTVEAYDPVWVGNIIGYWVSGGTMDELKVEYDKALKLPEKPIIAYLDGRDWPAEKPSWMKVNRTWIGVQCYRDLSESVADWDVTITKLLDRLDKWGLPMSLTAQFYDRNGTQTEAQVLEILPCYRDWLVNFNCVGMMAFAVMRPGGCHTYPKFGEWAKNYTEAITARPDRYAFWNPDSVPMKDVMTNALSQDVDYIWVDKARRDYLLSCLK